MFDLLNLLHFAGGAFLFGLTTYLKMRMSLAEVQQALAQVEKTLAEQGQVLAQTEKSLAEAQRTLAETKMTNLKSDQVRLEITSTHFTVQKELEAENEKYQEAQQAFVSGLEDLTVTCLEGRDATLERNEAVRILTAQVIDAFSNYLRRATVVYRSEPAPVIKSIIRTEVVPFLRELATAVETLNDEAIVSMCGGSQEPLEISMASLGPVQRCLLELGPRLSEADQLELAGELQLISSGPGADPLLPIKAVFPDLEPPTSHLLPASTPS